jgi:hypothetical protein
MQFTKKAFLLAFCLGFCLVSVANALTYQDVLPYLVDLSGWQSGKPTGMTSSMNGMNMVTASREYSQGEKKFNVSVAFGNPMFGAMSMMGMGMSMNIDTPEERIYTKTINGFMVVVTYEKQDKSGSVLVYLKKDQSNSGVITFDFQGISDQEAMQLARKFNWQGIKKLAP